MADIQAITANEQEVFESILTEEFIKFDKEVLMPFYQRILRAVRKVSDVPLVTGGNIFSSSLVKNRY